jgi:multidrug efflux pump subunit AcrB
MWEFFIKNNRFSYLFLVALIGVGTYALLSIPRESAPEVVIPVGVVTTVLPGAPAADVESLITNEIERGLTSLENVSEITSTSREGVSTVVVEFEASADLDDSIQDLKDEVDVITQELPADAEDPFVSEVNFVDQPIMTVAIAGDRSDRAFTLLADELERELETLPRVSRVEMSGVRDREVTVIVDQAALQRFNISLAEITSALRSANNTLPIGQIEQQGVSYNVAFEGDIVDTGVIGDIGITTRGGQPVYVRDVATVVDGLAPAASLSRLSVGGDPSEPSITVNVFKQSGGDITAIARNVNQRLAELQEPGELLEGLSVVAVLDSGELIEEDLTRLSLSGLQTVTLVVLLLIIAIGWREGLLAGLAIPFSFLFGFIGLYFTGNTINFLSLFSLILGIGILVDSAIVMVEGVNRKMKDDPTIDKQQAAIEAIREYATPLIAGTLTTVSMFAGLFIVSGVIGQFISSIPFTLISVLFASLFVALAILPLLASSFLRRRSSTTLEQKQVAYAHAFEEWYKEKLSSIIGNTRRERTFMWTLRAALVVAIMMPIIGLVPVIFFADGDVDYLIVEIEQPEGTVKEITDLSARRIEEILYTVPEIESYTVTVGSGSQFSDASGTGGGNEKLANMLLSLRDDRDRTSTEIVDGLRAEFASIRDFTVTVEQPSEGPPTGAAIVLKFLGDDLVELTGIANQAAQLMAEQPDFTNIETSTNNNNTEFVLELDRDRAAALGLDPFTISQLARTAVFGSDATSITTLTEDIDVVVRLNVANNPTVTPETTNVTDINALERISIPTAAGTVPLGSLVTVSLRESSSVINHEDSKRVVSVTADVVTGANARTLQTEVADLIQTTLALPADVVLSTGGGETEESNQAFLEMFLALIVGVALMVGVLTLQFNSYRHTVYVLSILPYSLIGIMTGLALTQNALSFPSMMGFIALSGIVVNNSILLIDMMNKTRVRQPLRSVRDIVIESAGKRLRPILLTTITTVIGMIPLLFAGELWAPLAYAVMFGLIFSVVITLILIPIIYNRKPGTVG